MPPPTSNIRVCVEWSQSTVFAGEEVGCKITFKNIAAIPGNPRIPPNPSGTHGPSPLGERHRKTKTTTSSQISDGRGRASNVSNSLSLPNTRGHRSALSLNVPAAGKFQQPDTRLGNDNVSESAPRSKGHSHRRSVSIISLGANETAGSDISGSNSNEPPRVPFRRHGRAASLQIVPRRPHPNGNGPKSASASAPPHRSATQPSPLFQNHSLSDITALRGDLGPHRKSTNSLDTLTSSSAPAATQGFRTGRRQASASPSQQGFKFPNTTFRFPATNSPGGDEQSPLEATENDLNGSIHSPKASNNLLSPPTKDDMAPGRDPTTLSARILSPMNNNSETPRNSGEFYSLSNNSTETLASEYIPPRAGLLGSRSDHTRQGSVISDVSQYRPTIESLMMGYAQIQGSFTLDGSLIDQEPFEEVKRKGVVGGQGGGVIGVEKNKRESGLLRGFGWGNISESLGGLLGGSDLSSIRDMRGIASSRSVPLLSTPQSILFVDLRLAPGESKSFQYKFKLPRGLPPTHRGRAIKIAYQLVLGTQRPGGSKEQQIKSVEVPFRVLGSVNDRGELLGHDLMSPYIILKDQASIRSISGQGSSAVEQSSKTTTNKKAQSSHDEFLSYVDDLLTRPRQPDNSLLSPTAPSQRRRLSSIPGPASAKEAIDMAILRSNLATDMQQSANRFEIARGGQRIAVVMLARPAYRLGETVTAIIEFADAEIACYAVHASLESSEKVDQSIALRSDASINRVTRKTHASHSESALFARRIVFSPSIPVASTPSFITSGVSLDWKILIEFVTPRVDRTKEGNPIHDSDLLEEVSRDDRGAVLAAAETLNCESFEIAVPLRVYGAVGSIDKEGVEEHKV
ncbi:hypothetical protein V490_04235 [Pseudogymnoascus sp. VKM F-3557]|nr:hypothetical protein V490_04235 [Pseudogymnoascus sp. VKM F-3557]